ncbi:dephospho-CoA kinase [Flavobacteriaceae bacterium 14752]|uniref:dephospho-CoA kinase n=1 Tax=Mesohalobacter salilacus TaxID=2491711 RepID=UPI000F641658|nr:dephospho-CoA kinase [Flavobacteriaceae bacterium 14752]
MKKPLVIGVTGGIGSGKSTVVNIFKQLDVPVYISDIKAKYLMQTNQNLISSIKEQFGKEAYDEDDKLNKDYLSHIVFNNPKKLEILNNLVHPVVREDFNIWLSYQNSDYVVYESALIFEQRQEDNFDYIILVIAPKKTRIKRVKKRDNISEDDIKKRMNKQMDDKLKIKKADYIINNINIGNLKKDIVEINDKILNI